MSTEALGPSKPEQVGREQRALLPQQRLLEAVFSEPQRPISPEKGEELAETVSEVLTSTLRPREAEVIIRRFGLASGTPETIAQIANDFQRTKGRIRQIEERALRRLRSPNNRDKLKEYVVLSEGPVAFSIAGLQLTYSDLKAVTNARLEELGPAIHLARYVASRMDREWKDVGELLTENREPFLRHLSAEQLKHLGDELRKVYERAQAGFYKEQEVVNRFLPYLEIKPDVLALIASRPIESLDLPTDIGGDLKRHGINTIGEVLNRPKLDFLRNSWIVEGMEWRLKAYIEAVEFEINPPPESEAFKTLAGISTVWINKIVGTRVSYALARGNIYTVAQVLNMTEKELLRVKGFGQKSLNELKAAIIRLTTSQPPLSPS